MLIAQYKWVKTLNKNTLNVNISNVYNSYYMIQFDQIHDPDKLVKLWENLNSYLPNN